MTIAKEAWPIALIVAAVSVAVGWLLHPAAGLVGLPAMAFVLWFFRDPERQTPLDSRALFSPADGKIIQAGPRTISVFMNVFNVHVCRAPAAGKLLAVEHHDGRFLAAFKDDAPECNERVCLDLDLGGARVQFILIAGLVARRIVCKARPGQEVAAGERIGLIQFGSRVDVRLPAGYEPAVAIGDRAVAGETLVARLPDAPQV